MAVVEEVADAKKIFEASRFCINTKSHFYFFFTFFHNSVGVVKRMIVGRTDAKKILKS